MPDSESKDFLIVLTYGGAAFGTGLYSLVERSWVFGGVFTIGALVAMAPLSPSVRRVTASLVPRKVIWTFGVVTWLFLAANIGLAIFPPSPGPPQTDQRDATITDLRGQLNAANQQIEAMGRRLQGPQRTPTVSPSSVATPQKQPLSREELQQINTKSGILQNVRDDYLKRFTPLYDMWAMWKTNWSLAIKTNRQSSLDLLSYLKTHLQDEAQRLEGLRVEYPEYHDISDILAQPQTSRVLKALDDLLAGVAALSDPPPPDFDQRLRPYFGALAAEFDVMKDWIGNTQAATNRKIKEFAELRQQ